jgi:hypothetical protein
MERTTWVDEVDIYNDTVILKFETIWDDVNHSGNHVQRIQKMVLEWDEYRSWIAKREVRDVVRLYLKDQSQNNGIDTSQSGNDPEVDQEQQ